MSNFVAISRDFANLFIKGYLDRQMKKFGKMGQCNGLKYKSEFMSGLASLCESPQRVSKWGMGCPFLEIKKRGENMAGENTL